MLILVEPWNTTYHNIQGASGQDSDMRDIIERAIAGVVIIKFHFLFMLCHAGKCEPKYEYGRFPPKTNFLFFIQANVSQVGAVFHDFSRQTVDCELKSLHW